VALNHKLLEDLAEDQLALEFHNIMEVTVDLLEQADLAQLQHVVIHVILAEVEAGHMQVLTPLTQVTPNGGVVPEEA